MGLDAELEGLKDSACPIPDEFNGDLAGDAAKGLSDSDRAKSPTGLAQSHDGRSTNERTKRLGNLTLEKEIDHLSNETQEEIRRGQPHGVANVGWPEPRTTGSRSGREGVHDLTNLIHLGDRSGA